MAFLTLDKISPYLRSQMLSKKRNLDETYTSGIQSTKIQSSSIDSIHREADFSGNEDEIDYVGKGLNSKMTIDDNQPFIKGYHPQLLEYTSNYNLSDDSETELTNLTIRDNQLLRNIYSPSYSYLKSNLFLPRRMYATPDAKYVWDSNVNGYEYPTKLGDYVSYMGVVDEIENPLSIGTGKNKHILEVPSNGTSEIRITKKRQVYVWMESTGVQKHDFNQYDDGNLTDEERTRLYKIRGQFDEMTTIESSPMQIRIKSVSNNNFTDAVYSGIDRENRFNINNAEIIGGSLLEKTRYLFEAGKINTIVSGFYKLDSPSEIQTAVSEYGVSKGRNLLGGMKITPSMYDDPYCRVWTWESQYRTLQNAIRPFLIDASLDTGNEGKFVPLKEIHKKGVDNGFRSVLTLDNFDKFTSLQDNGLPKIAPYKSDFSADPNGVFTNPMGVQYAANKQDRWRFNRNYFFSIENLAWKDLDIEKLLCPSQIGPNGGRIMWFSPLNLDFDETATVNLNRESFIGRGEQVITYIDTTRMGNLTFSMVVDHSSFMEFMKYRENLDTDAAYQGILRWDAGCEDVSKLEMNDIYNHASTTKVIKPEGEDPIKPTKPTTVEAEKKEVKKVLSDPIIITKVYYPNDFSGADMNGEETMRYLYLGCGQGYGQADENGYEMGGPRTLSNVTTDGHVMYSWNDTRSIDISGCTTTDTFVEKNLWTNYADNMTKTDSLSHYKDPPHLTKIDKIPSKMDKLPRARYVAHISYYDVTQYGLNNTKPAENGNGYSFKEFYEAALNNDETLYKTLKEAKTVTITGCASPQGYANDNIVLAKFRAERLRDFIGYVWSDLNVQDTNKWKIETIKKPGGASGCASNKDYKEYRYAFISVINESDDPEATSINEANILKANELNEKNKQEYDEAVKAYEEAVKTRENQTKTVTYKNGRYDEEMAFYKYIDENVDLTFSKIKDKYSHYIPCFWSLTPEGFNARLTFLHQCTRQGPTISASETQKDTSKKITTARNLAFGRPPVCILKIGDFIQSRIYIESLSIDFKNQDRIQWDLNPEGIGIQPMMCTVRISFLFMGGQDISGAIAQLQNAVTFNYYANTSTYDNRAAYIDGGVVKENGTVPTESIHLFDPYSEDTSMLEGYLDYLGTKQEWEGEQARIAQVAAEDEENERRKQAEQVTQQQEVQAAQQQANASRGLNPNADEVKQQENTQNPLTRSAEQVTQDLYAQTHRETQLTYNEVVEAQKNKGVTPSKDLNDYPNKRNDVNDSIFNRGKTKVIQTGLPYPYNTMVVADTGNTNTFGRSGAGGSW